MNIGVNTRLFQNTETGIQHYIKSVYNQLQKNSNDSYVLFQTNNSKKLGPTITFPVGRSNLGALIFDVWAVLVLILKSRVQLYHGPAHILPFFKIPGVVYVVSIMDLSFLTVPHLSGRIFNWYYSYIVGRSLKIADGVIAISESTKKDIVKYYGLHPDKITVTHLGIDECYFDTNKLQRIVQPSYFFSITTHPKRKNIYGILDAMVTLGTGLQSTFVLAGLLSEESKSELVNEIARRGLQERVILKGYVTQEELISLYQHAQFFIYPSFYEGFGLPPVEAMACRCPCIVSLTSSLPEVQPDTRWQIDPYSPSDIARVIQSLLDLSAQERSKLIDTQYAFCKQFTWSKTAQKTHRLFEKLLMKS